MLGTTFLTTFSQLIVEATSLLHGPTTDSTYIMQQSQPGTSAVVESFVFLDLL